MKINTLKRQQVIRRPLREIFPFFSRPENLALLTPPNLRFQMLTPFPIEMKDGALIDYVITLYGSHLRWTTLITDFNPPYTFADVQLRGPYSYWHHSHTFTETDEGAIMTDEVHYAMPFGVLGELAHELIVKHQLKRIFDFRGRQIEAKFPALDAARAQRESIR
jgi:ligand-binding SRPBCC domain-containing protein